MGEINLAGKGAGRTGGTVAVQAGAGRTGGIVAAQGRTGGAVDARAGAGRAGGAVAARAGAGRTGGIVVAQGRAGVKAAASPGAGRAGGAAAARAGAGHAGGAAAAQGRAGVKAAASPGAGRTGGIVAAQGRTGGAVAVQADAGRAGGAKPLRKTIVAHAERRSRRRRSFVATALAIFLVVASEPTAAYVYEGLDSRGFFEDPAAALVYSKQKIMNFFNTAYGGEASADVGANGAQFDPGFESGGLYSSAALLAELDTGTVLLKKNAELRIYPASLTKMMTALLAAEYLDGLPEAISVDPSIFPGLYVANASMAGFMPGEEVRAEDLVYGVMVASGAECCIALAQAIAGSEEAFVEMMNARAKEIGMYGTHFTNSTGLHDPEHFSTARDMAKLLLIALSNELFESAFTAAAHTTAPTSMRPDGWLMESDVFAKMDAAGFPEGLVAGGKAGYTQEAGQCLASVAEKGGKRYIFVSTGNGVEKKGMAYSIEDALNVYSNALR